MHCNNLEANHAISMPSKTGEPFHTLVGTDTFRGIATQAQLSRTQLYEKNTGDTRIERTGLVRTDSPVSGILMLHAQPHRHAVKDPIAGSTLQYHGSKAGACEAEGKAAMRACMRPSPMPMASLACVQW